MCTQYWICVLVSFCLFPIVCGQTTTEPSCDTSTQCLLDNTLLVNITCTESSHGQTNIPGCYDEYFSFTNCKCTEPYETISETDRTYWCNPGGQWDSALSSLVCSASCTTDAEPDVISRNPAGEETNIILHGEYVNYTCPEGYSGVGTSLVYCDDGSWSDHVTYDCLESCSLPDNYEFVDTPIADPVPHGNVVVIKCKENYTPSDPITSECIDGVFQDAVTCQLQGTTSELPSTTKQTALLTSSQPPEATTEAAGTFTNTDTLFSTTLTETKLVSFITGTDVTRSATDSGSLTTQQNTEIVEETSFVTNVADLETDATEIITDIDTKSVTDGTTQQVTEIEEETDMVTDATATETKVITESDTDSVTNGVPFTTLQVTEFVAETDTLTRVTGTTEIATDSKIELSTEIVKVTDQVTNQVTNDGATEVTTNAVTEPATDVNSKTTDQATESVRETDFYTDQFITESDRTETITDTVTETMTYKTLTTEQITETVGKTDLSTDTAATTILTNTDTESSTKFVSLATEGVTEVVEETDPVTDQVITETVTESITETDTETNVAVTTLPTEQITEIVGETEVVTDQVVTETDNTESITEAGTKTTATEVISLTTEQVTDFVGETELTTDQVITEIDVTELKTEIVTETDIAVTTLPTEQITEIVGETEVVTDQVVTETDNTESITETDTETDVAVTTEIVGETEVVTDQVVTETDIPELITETFTETITAVTSSITEQETEIVRETEVVTDQVLTRTDVTKLITETDTATATEVTDQVVTETDATTLRTGTDRITATEVVPLSTERVTNIVGETDFITHQVTTETNTETATDVVSLTTEQVTKIDETTDIVTDKVVTDTDLTGATTKSSTSILTGSTAIIGSDTTFTTSTLQHTRGVQTTDMGTDEVITVTDILTDSFSSTINIVTGTASDTETTTGRFGTDATETTAVITATSGLGAETDVVTGVTLTAAITGSTNSSPEKSTERSTDGTVSRATNTRETEVPTSHPTVTPSDGSETPTIQYTTTTASAVPYTTDIRTNMFTTEPMVTTKPDTTAPASTEPMVTTKPDTTTPASTDCENPLTNSEDTDVIDVNPYKFIYTDGDEIEYLCPSGYSLEGESSAVCVSGLWSPSELPTCKAILCPRPELSDPNVVLDPPLEEYEQGADIEFTCPDGFTLVGIQSATCNDGEFILEEEPQCVENVESFCSQSDTSGEVIFTPDRTFYGVGDVVTFSCADIGLTLSSTQPATCSSEGQWSVPIPSCGLCKFNENGQCSGKSNNVCNRETGRCTCLPGQVLNGDKCITKTAIRTTARLDTDFNEDLEDSSTEYYKTLEEEICLGFETTLTKRNTNVKTGYVSCFVSSFTSGSIVADVVTEYDEAANVTAEQVTDVLLVELQANKNQLGNYSIPGLSFNFSIAPNSSETVITNDACEAKTDICDPTYGECTFVSGSLYTCSCINAYDYYEDSISTVPGVACFVIDGPNYALIIGLALGIPLVLMATIMFGVAMLGPWCTKRKHKTYINPKSTLHDGWEDHTVKSNDYANGGYTVHEVENGELVVDEEKLEAIATIIQNMGETSPIPRASLKEETSFSFRESTLDNGGDEQFS